MIRLQYKELVYQKIVDWHNWRGPYHHHSYGIIVTLECGHMKPYPRGKTPNSEALCHICTMNQAAGMKWDEATSNSQSERIDVRRNINIDAISNKVHYQGYKMKRIK